MQPTRVKKRPSRSDTKINNDIKALNALKQDPNLELKENCWYKYFSVYYDSDGKLVAELKGPPTSPYENGVYLVKIIIPTRSVYKIPRLKFFRNTIPLACNINANQITLQPHMNKPNWKNGIEELPIYEIINEVYNNTFNYCGTLNQIEGCFGDNYDSLIQNPKKFIDDAYNHNLKMINNDNIGNIDSHQVTSMISKYLTNDEFESEYNQFQLFLTNYLQTIYNIPQELVTDIIMEYIGCKHKSYFCYLNEKLLDFIDDSHEYWTLLQQNSNLEMSKKLGYYDNGKNEFLVRIRVERETRLKQVKVIKCNKNHTTQEFAQLCSDVYRRDIKDLGRFFYRGHLIPKSTANTLEYYLIHDQSEVTIF